MSMTRSQAAEGSSNVWIARCRPGMPGCAWLAIGAWWGEVTHATGGGGGAPGRNAKIMPTSRGDGEQRMWRRAAHGRLDSELTRIPERFIALSEHQKW